MVGVNQKVVAFAQIKVCKKLDLKILLYKNGTCFLLSFFLPSTQVACQIDLANKQIRRTHVLILLTKKFSNLCT
jgi:hypothetical protein